MTDGGSNGITGNRQMKESILEMSAGLAWTVGQVAEAAGYLWQKGWAERNGGNITVNVTEHITDDIRRLPSISGRIPLGRNG